MVSNTLKKPPHHDEGGDDSDGKVGRNQARSDHGPSDIAPSKNASLDHVIPIRLKALRMSLSLSAAMMDRQAGFSTGTTGRLERGDLRVYANHLYRICEATGVAIGYFYDQFDISNTNANTTAGAQELEKQRLLLAYMKIKDPALKRDVFELVETLATECAPKKS